MSEFSGSESSDADAQERQRQQELDDEAARQLLEEQQMEHPESPPPTPPAVEEHDDVAVTPPDEPEVKPASPPADDEAADPGPEDDPEDDAKAEQDDDGEDDTEEIEAAAAPAPPAEGPMPVHEEADSTIYVRELGVPDDRPETPAAAVEEHDDVAVTPPDEPEVKPASPPADDEAADPGPEDDPEDDAKAEQDDDGEDDTEEIEAAAGDEGEVETDLGFLDDVVHDLGDILMRMSADSAGRWPTDDSDMSSYGVAEFDEAFPDMTLEEIIVEQIGTNPDNVGMDIMGGSNAAALQELMVHGVISEGIFTDIRDSRYDVTKDNRGLHPVFGDMLDAETWQSLIAKQQEVAPDGVAVAMWRPVGSEQMLQPSVYEGAVNAVLDMVRPGGVLFAQVPLRYVLDSDASARSFLSSLSHRGDIDRVVPSDHFDLHDEDKLIMLRGLLIFKK